MPGPTGADLGACAGPPLAGRTADNGRLVYGTIPVGECECPGPTGADLCACAGPPLAGRTVDTGPEAYGAIPVGERECLVSVEQISAHVQGLHWLGGL